MVLTCVNINIGSPTPSCMSCFCVIWSRSNSCEVATRWDHRPAGGCDVPGRPEDPVWSGRRLAWHEIVWCMWTNERNKKETQTKLVELKKICQHAMECSFFCFEGFMSELMILTSSTPGSSGKSGSFLTPPACKWVTDSGFASQLDWGNEGQNMNPKTYKLPCCATKKRLQNNSPTILAADAK